jgi:hypothetical protein
MKKSLILLLGLFLILSGCAKKVETVKINGWEKYSDSMLKISFTHPAGWHLEQEGSKISFYSSVDVVNKFTQYAVEGKDGSRIIVNMTKMVPSPSLQQCVDSLKADLNNMGFEVSATEAKTVHNLPASQVAYAGSLDAKNKVQGAQTTVVRDSMVFSIRYEGFNQSYVDCKAALDSAITSLTLPTVRAKDADPSIPAPEMEAFENNFLKIMRPANFDANSPQPKAPSEFSLDISGYRKDSGIRVDIIPAKGLTQEKVLEQNARFFKETSRGQAAINGTNVPYLNYMGGKDIQSRVYFMVKNDKIYRCILNYYAPMKAIYLPVFEKVVGSLTVK